MTISVLWRESVDLWLEEEILELFLLEAEDIVVQVEEDEWNQETWWLEKSRLKRWYMQKINWIGFVRQGM